MKQTIGIKQNNSFNDLNLTVDSDGTIRISYKDSSIRTSVWIERCKGLRDRYFIGFPMKLSGQNVSDAEEKHIIDYFRSLYVVNTFYFVDRFASY